MTSRANFNVSLCREQTPSITVLYPKSARKIISGMFCTLFEDNIIHVTGAETKGEAIVDYLSNVDRTTSPLERRVLERERERDARWGSDSEQAVGRGK